MLDLHLIHKIFIFLINIVGVYLCFLVYSSNPKSKISRFFILMMISMFFWVNFAYLARITDYAQLSLIFLKIAWFVTPLFFLFIYFFTVYLIKEEKKYRALSGLVLFLGIITAFATGLTNLIINGVRFVNGDLTIIYGRGMIPFLAVVFLFICATLYSLFKKYSVISAREKIKIEYFLIGIFIFYLANIIFNITLPLFFNIVHFYYFGDYSTIIFLTFTAYAITKHNLMGIKTLLTQTLIVVISIILLLDIFTLSDNLTMQILKIGILITFLYFSRGMIKSVKKEYQAREELQKIYRKVNRYAKKLEKANQNLEELLESKDDFLHITSHQLRTPLTVIRGMLAMWQAGDFDGLSEKERKKTIEKIYLSAERLNNITNDMLDAMEVEGKFLKFNLEFVSLENIIRDVMDELKPNYDKKKLYLKLNIKSKLPKIKLEPKYFKQALMNLLDNAEKYTPRGGVEINVYPAVFKKGEKGKFALIEIKDTGIGISKRDQKKLFQKFSRTGNAVKQNTTGSGLGLFIAKQIIDEHEGKIEISSEGVGKGAAVRVWLPRG